MELLKGDRVQTKFGDGTIVYKRMVGPEYCEAAMYSVCLDHKLGTEGYTGTIVLPTELQSFSG